MITPDSEGGEMALVGVVQPPMANGEPVFEVPWQGRVFGMARALCERDIFHWDEFREKLIAEIGADESIGDYRYFDHFLMALTVLLEEKQLFGVDELNGRTHEYSERPHGHDHST
jgi:nitrile hydratase accessory protein